MFFRDKSGPASDSRTEMEIKAAAGRKFESKARVTPLGIC